MRRPQVYGESQEGLYHSSPIPRMFSNFSKTTCRKIITNPSNSSVSILVSNNGSAISFPICTSVVSDVKLWHIRLGNFSFSLMKNVNFLYFPSNSDCFCDIFPKTSGE